MNVFATLALDERNPGHYFAACGLLEIAYRLWPDAEGFFPYQNRFSLQSTDPDASVSGLLDVVYHSKFHEVSENGSIILSATSPNSPFPLLRLDWWIQNEKQGSAASYYRPPKTWAGGQKAHQILCGAQRALKDFKANTDLFNQTAFLHKTPKRTGKPIVAFYFDARRRIHALDTGFALDDIGGRSVEYPVVELFAFLGLQRFAPHHSSRSTYSFYDYWTWSTPLSASAAPAAACGSGRTSSSRGYRFPLLYRDDSRKSKAFGWAKRLEETQ